MSRVIKPTAPSQKSQKSMEPESAQLQMARNSMLKLLSILINSKVKKNQKYFFLKANAYCQNQKKNGKAFFAILNCLSHQKATAYLKLGFMKLSLNKQTQRKIEYESTQRKKVMMKNSSSNLMSIIFRKLYTKNMKTSFTLLRRQIRKKKNTEIYRAGHVARLFSELVSRRMKEGWRKIKLRKIYYLKMKSQWAYVDRIMVYKIKNNLRKALLRIKMSGIEQKKIEQKKIEQKKIEQKKGEESKLSSNMEKELKSNQRLVKAKTKGTDQSNQKEIEEKNQQLKEKMQLLKKENEQIVEEYRQQIAKYEEEHESLKFNSDLLDQANRDLQTELLQRKKRNRKKMSNAQLWDSVYSNFLFLISQYKGQVLPKQLILSHLECPLPPLSVDPDAIRMENETLSELLEEYRKFYEDQPPQSQAHEDLLSFDLLSCKNRFLYLAAQSLIDQGVGTENEIKQLEIDLDNISKHG